MKPQETAGGEAVGEIRDESGSREEGRASLLQQVSGPGMWPCVPGF